MTALPPEISGIFSGPAPWLMGVVNITPDSFSDGGAYLDPGAALDHAARLMDEGAAILDVGAESTRPGASAVSPEEEWARLDPVLPRMCMLAQARGVRVSVDTRHASTMRRALACGVSIINDVSALRHDPAALEIVARSRAHIIMMHMQGTPEDMQQNPHYASGIMAALREFFQERLRACAAAGMDLARCWIDPGIGFGKTLAHNQEILRRLSELSDLAPLVLGVSRKSFISALAGAPGAALPPAERLPGSLIAAVLGAQRGAQILRVHDVAATRQALRVAQGLAA